MMASKRGRVADTTQAAVGKKSKRKCFRLGSREDSWLHPAHYPDLVLHQSYHPNPRLHHPDPRLHHLDPRFTQGLTLNNSYLLASSHNQSATLPPHVFPPYLPSEEGEPMDWENSIYTETMVWPGSQLDHEVPMEWD
ncbi:uncharacterized protein LOC118409853 [Branchiostoma floridae]|uniref:Uncharacterized protein LOC118409853 n=2 Tax=Branchiostoma floridae TaxID=7739 RepID=A0A9J7MGL7_BRAFL|nr:uncharacterized protein LOC118409853 [Branchiostoma floridae]